jgi:hypothetical protein
MSMWKFVTNPFCEQPLLQHCGESAFGAGSSRSQEGTGSQATGCIVFASNAATLASTLFGGEGGGESLLWPQTPASVGGGTGVPCIPRIFAIMHQIILTGRFKILVVQNTQSLCFILPEINFGPAQVTRFHENLLRQVVQKTGGTKIQNTDGAQATSVFGTSLSYLLVCSKFSNQAWAKAGSWAPPFCKGLGRERSRLCLDNTQKHYVCQNICI